MRPAIDTSTATAPPRQRLVRKYVAFIVTLVASLLLASSAVQLYVSYQENRQALAQLQQEKARAAASRIEQFLQAIIGQLGWSTHPQPVSGEAALEQRRLDYYRLLRQAPALTDLSYFDAGGHEQLHISRLSLDVASSEQRRDAAEPFRVAKAEGFYRGPVYFRKDSEPYMTLAMPAADGGVTVAEVNLKFTWDVVAAIQIGKAGLAYVIGPDGRLIAHPDIGLVLQQSDFAKLSQVQAARAALAQGPAPETTLIARDRHGRQVLTSYAAVAPTGWLVFLEQPLEEALAPLYASLLRTAALLPIDLGLALLVSVLLARRMVRPIRALQTGAARIGAGELASRIAVHTGDELEALADSFNQMAAQLEASYAGLERKVNERTQALARSVAELQALGEVSRAVNSTLDLEQVLSAIAARAVQLSETDGGAIYEYDEATQALQLRATFQLPPALIALLRETPMGLGEGALGQAAVTRQPVQVQHLADEGTLHYRAELRAAILQADLQALLAVPLLREVRLIGGLIVGRRLPGDFSPRVIELLQTFATHSAMAIQNARLFRELEEKSHQLALASQHKSQFLANMSHELRTPLNAILGYTELIVDEIYGPVPEKIREVLARIEHNARHLLGLINAVLDLSKIEAGRLTLALGAYAMRDVVYSVAGALEALAAEKGLALTVSLPPELPAGQGDEQRIRQVLLNLVGNAIKFTESGTVQITVTALDGAFKVAVADTGPGIALADQPRIFDEFQQLDSSSTREKGGTGLGLAIAKKIIELHGGRIGVESAPGQGATFWFTLPVCVEQQQEAA
jgi:signal transduction histidine kinase